ncbi:30S ribosomal protein THX [Cellulosispirillum alkaliphilum]
MGRGDRRSRKGKIFRKSFGKTRPRKEKNEQQSNKTISQS